MDRDDSVTGLPAAERASVQPLTKRPYEPPKLVELGDIRELTRTGGRTSGDGFITRKGV
jgi:hypothetical protein